jgi:hypothetical protein
MNPGSPFEGPELISTSDGDVRLALRHRGSPLSATLNFIPIDTVASLLADTRYEFRD